jgi:tetraacyldisaccharide 4'-kinase
MKSRLRRLFDGAVLDERSGFSWDCVRVVLSLLSLVYRFGIALRRCAFALGLKRRRKVSVPVISVGNITTGGTGKSPMVEFLVKTLVEQGHRPAVLTRGYGRIPGGGDDEVFSDPSLSHIRRYVDPKRTRSAEQAIREGATILIMDDGFQHWALHRDLDIVLIDGLRPWGKNNVLPRGTLREPLKALRRASMFIITRSNQAESGALKSIESRLEGIHPEAPILHAVHQPLDWSRFPSTESRDLEELQGRRALVFSGIGNPYAFAKTLSQIGVDVVRHRAFPDHHLFTTEQIESIRSQAPEFMANLILTTEKDARRVTPDGWTTECGFVRVRARITRGLDTLLERIRDLVPAPSSTEPSPAETTHGQ